MRLRAQLEQFKTRRASLRQITLCPGTPGALRLHLVAPALHPFKEVPHVVLVNGYYVLPLYARQALLLGCYMDALAPLDGLALGDKDMEPVVRMAVRRASQILGEPQSALVGELGNLLDGFYRVATGGEAGLDTPHLSLRQYARYMRAPHRMDLLVSALHKNGRWNCNLKCRHCYAAGQPGAGLAELTTRQWMQAIDRCGQAGIAQLTFTGGEPTLRQDLPRLVAHAKAFVTRLNTNGARLSRELCTALKEANLDSVQFTVYSCEGAIHDPLVGAEDAPDSGSLAKTLAGLQNALSAGLDVSVNTPLCADNRDYVQTLRRLHSLGVRYVSCSGLIQTGRAASEDSLRQQLTGGQLTDILWEAAAFCKAHGMSLSFTSPGWVEGETLQSMGLTTPVCGAALSNMAIAPDGTVVPCQSWLGHNAGLGNILQDNWRGIWRGKLCRDIRAMDAQEAETCPLRGGRFTQEEG